MTLEEFYLANRFAEVFNNYRYGYENNEAPIEFNKLKDPYKKVIERNFNIAENIQQLIFEQKNIQEGDAIATPDGVIRGFVTNRPYDLPSGLSLQALKNCLYMNHHRNPYGGGSYSGVCGDVFKYKKAIDTEMHIRSTGWFWADNSAGGARGLVYAFQVKIWQLYV